MPEIGRFFGVDPVSSEYMSISTFQFAHNNPVWKIELEGLKGIKVVERRQKGRGPNGTLMRHERWQRTVSQMSRQEQANVAAAAKAMKSWKGKSLPRISPLGLLITALEIAFEKDDNTKQPSTSIKQGTQIKIDKKFRLPSPIIKS